MAQPRAFADAAAAPADSNAEQSEGLEEITVTATRRSVSSQSVPLSLTAIGAAELQQQGITSTAQLNQLAPSLYVQEGVGAGSPRYSLRGISTTDVGPTGSAPIAIYVDDVSQSNAFGNSMNLFDVERIEVLRGPQGTLFGRNTTGGAISYFSQTPTNTLEGYVTTRFAGGDQSSQSIEGAINLPLIDQVLAMRLSFHADHAGDYVNDTELNRSYGQGHSGAGRLQLRWTPGDDTTVNLTLFGMSRRGDAPIYHGQYVAPCDEVLGAYLCNGSTPKPSPALNPNTVASSDIDQFEDFSNEGVIVRLEQAIGTSKLTSITSYKHTNYNVTEDEDGLPGDYFDIYGPIASKEATEEVRFSTDTSQRISGVLGLYYEYDHLVTDPVYGATLNGPFLDYVTRLDQTNNTRSYAAFGNVTFVLTDQLSLTGGLRKSEDQRSNVGSTYYFFSGNYDWTQSNVLYPLNAPPVPPTFVAPYDQRETWRPWTWDATLDYKPASDVLVFARVADGFRSGGFNTASLTPAPAFPAYNPETLKSYEIGFKSTLLRNTLQINGTLYHYNYDNLQVSTTVVGVLETANAATAKVDGGELEVVARPTPPLELRSSVSYTHSRFTDYQSGTVSYTGNVLPQSPKRTANASASYVLPVTPNWDLTPSTSWSYRSQVFFDQTEDPNISSPSLVTGNLRLAVAPRNNGLSVAAFVNNVTDRRPATYGYAFYPEYYAETFAVGRTYGADITYRW